MNYNYFLKAFSIPILNISVIKGDDTEANVLRLCVKALNPIRKDILNELDLDFELTCGAVCVYPARVEDAAQHLKNSGSSLPVASGKLKI